jgi:GH24 family phage-related lysozyme (muramidase)
MDGAGNVYSTNGASVFQKSPSGVTEAVIGPIASGIRIAEVTKGGKVLVYTPITGIDVNTAVQLFLVSFGAAPQVTQIPLPVAPEGYTVSMFDYQTPGNSIGHPTISPGMVDDAGDVFATALFTSGPSSGPSIIEEAFRWTPTGGSKSLATLIGSTGPSYIDDVTDGGDVLVSGYAPSQYITPILYLLSFGATPQITMIPAPPMPPGAPPTVPGYPYAFLGGRIDDAGDVFAFAQYDPATVPNSGVVFRWTQGNGTQTLSSLVGGGSFAWLDDVSKGGIVLVNNLTGNLYLVASAIPGMAIWTGDGANELWSNPANWQGETVPKANSIVLLPMGARQLIAVNDLGYGFNSVFVQGNYVTAGKPLSAAQLEVQGGVLHLGTSANVNALDMRNTANGGGSFFSITASTSISWPFITQQEGERTTAYVSTGKSGVAIGMGDDFGNQSLSTLESILQDANARLPADQQVSSTIQQELLAAQGLHGQDAQGYLNGLASPITVTPEQAAALDEAFKHALIDPIVQQYDNAIDAYNQANGTSLSHFADLPPDAQTAIADVAWQYGPTSSYPAFWSYVTSGNWSKALEELNHWSNTDTPASDQSRRTLDANLLAGAFQVTETTNPNGTLSSSTMSDGSETSYSYNPDGSIAGTTTTDASGNVISETTYVYNDDGTLKSSTTTDANGELVSQVTWAYNSDGSLASSTSTDGSGFSTTATYGSDGNLTGFNVTDPVTGTATNYTYDPNGDTATESFSSPSGTTLYTFNPDGTIGSMQYTDPDGKVFSTNYQYDNGQLASTTTTDDQGNSYTTSYQDAYNNVVTQGHLVFNRVVPRVFRRAAGRG